MLKKHWFAIYMTYGNIWGWHIDGITLEDR
jgi:hypothetical protein